MAKNFKTGLIITGDADGGVRAVRATSSELRKLNQDFDTGSKRARSFSNETRETSRELEFLKQHALSVGAAIAGAFAANNLGQQAVMIRNTDALAESLQVNTKTLQQWQFAGRKVGLEADKVGDIFKDVSDKVGDFAATGGGEAKDLFENLNLSIRELQSLSPDKQILRIADAINEIEDPNQRSFYFESLADEMVRLQPLLADGAQGLREASDMADALGVAMDDIEVRRAVEAAEAMDQLQGVAQGLSNTLIADLGPGLVDSTRSLTEFIDEVGGADEVLEGIGQTITTLGSVYLAVRLRKPLSKIGPLGLAAGRSIATGFSLAVGASGRLNQALVVTQGRIAATAAAGRALKASLALIGGPAGAALLAAGGIYTFREELGLTIPKADASSEAVHQLTGKLEELNKAAAEKKLTELNNRLADLKASAEETGQAYLEVGQDDTGHGGFLGADVSGQVKKIQEIGEGAKESRQEMANVEEAIAIVRDRLEELNSTGERTPPVLTDIGDSSEEAAKQAEQFASSLRGLLDELNPVQKSQREFRQSQILLQTALMQGKITIEEYFASIQKLEASYRNAGTAAEAYGLDGSNAMKKVEDSVDPMVKTWERGIERMDDAAVDMWRSFLDGSEDAFDSFKNLAIDTLAEVIHAYTTQQITTSISAQLGVSGQESTAAGAGGLGGLGDIGSLGKTLYNGVVDGFGSINWMGASNTAYGGGWAGSATSGIGQSGFMGGSLSNFGGMTGLASAGTGLVGNWAGNALFDGGRTSQHLGTLGAGIGTFFGGPIGAGIGSFLGQGIGSLFGDKYSGEDPTGLLATRNQYGQAGRSGWERDAMATGALGDVGFAPDSRDIDTLFGDRDNFENAKKYAEQLAQLDNTVAQLAKSEAELNEMRQAAADQGLTDISDVEGRYTAILGTLDGEFGEFVQSLDGSIEEIVQTGVTARQAFVTLSDASERLDLRFNDTTASAYEAASSLAEMAGGVQNLSSLQQNYYQTLYSEQERLNQLRSDITQQLNAMGMSLPRTRDGFRQLVEAQDLNTEAGRENYAQLLQLVDGFDRLQESASSLNDEAGRLADKIAGLKDDVKSAYEAFQNQAFDQRVQLLELAGKGEAALALQREKELESIDPLLHETQRHIWAMQDEAEAKEQATRAANDYAAQLGEIGSALSGVGGWLDQRRATQQSPMDNRREAEAQFERQLAMARSGDRDALQSITQYADRFLSAEESMHASGAQYQRTEQRVYKALEGLPDAISDAEYIVDGFRDVVTGELAGAIETAILDSQYTIDTLIDFAANTDQLPDDLRTILGEQAHRLDSVLNYLVGKNDLDAELRQLALTSSNRLVSTIDLVAGTDELSRADRRLALQGSNLFTSTIDLALGEDLSAQNRRLALQSSNAYSSVVDLVLGADLSADSRTLALESSHAYAAAINFAVGSDISSESRTIALSGGNTYRTLMQYAVDQDISQQDRRLALRAGNRYASRIDMILRRDELSADDRRLALSRVNEYASTIDLILGADISDQERQLALGTSNRLTSTIDAALGNVGPQERTLAFHSANAIQTTISGALANNIPDNVRQLALQNANRMTTTVKGVLRDTPPNVRKFALERSNSLTATVSGVLASNVGDDVKTLALKHANSFTTTLRAVLDDNSISNDERKLLDARSEQIVKTLRTDGGLDLTDEEWAVISAASGSKRMELLADVAFNQSDLNELDGIQDNTKSMEERARDQLERLNALVSEMANTTDQFVDMNSTMVSLRDSINALGVAQEEQNRIERERREREQREQERLAQERREQEKRAKADTITSRAGSIESKIAELQSLANKTGQTAIGSLVDDFREQDWITMEREAFHSRISDWSQARRMSAYTARRLELIEDQEAKLDPLREDYRALMGEPAPFAKGGVFTNSIVDKPTLFDMGVMGEATPEAIMPLHRGPDGGLGIRAELPPIPALPLLGQSDIVETLNDLRREVAGLRAENARLLGESNEHLGAANRQRGEGMKRQIEATERGNESLDRISSEAQLEAAR
ncbi:hypothetical protein QC589_01435 [Halomonas elongata]|uniref:hypothetical protein n=1 Tax=Halomonas elongata TaxID=2746 RepID=UPI00335E02B5